MLHNPSDPVAHLSPLNLTYIDTTPQSGFIPLQKTKKFQRLQEIQHNKTWKNNLSINKTSARIHKQFLVPCQFIFFVAQTIYKSTEWAPTKRIYRIEEKYCARHCRSYNIYIWTKKRVCNILSVYSPQSYGVDL